MQHFFCTFLCRCFIRLQSEICRNFLVTRFWEKMLYVFSITFFKLNTLDKQSPLSAFVFVDSLVVSALQDADGYAISRQNNLELHLGYLTCWDSGGQFYINQCILSTRASIWCLCLQECGNIYIKNWRFFFLFVKGAPVFLVKFEHPLPSEVQSLRTKFKSLGDVLLTERLNYKTFSGERMPGMSTCKIRKYGLVYTQVAQA